MSKPSSNTPIRANSFTLLSWAILFTLYAFVGAFLWCLLISCAVLSLIWVGIPLTVGVIGWMRAFTTFHRRWSERVMGVKIGTPYAYGKNTSGSSLARLRVLAADPATKRDQWWLLANASAGVALNFAVVALYVYGVWCIVFPYVYSQATPGAFNDTWIFFKVHSQASAFLTIIPGVVVLAIWWFATPKLMQAYASLNKSLLGQR